MPTISKTPPDESGFSLCHRIFVLDAFLCAPLDCDDRERITRMFLRDTLATLDMQPLAPAGIYPAADERAPGWSFIQPITTSHVSAHYFARPGRLPNLRLDAYSCEQFDWQALLRLCHRHFSLERWRANLVRRRIDEDGERTVHSMEGHGPHITSEERLVEAGRVHIQVMNDERDIRKLA